MTMPVFDDPIRAAFIKARRKARVRHIVLVCAWGAPLLIGAIAVILLATV